MSPIKARQGIERLLAEAIRLHDAGDGDGALAGYQVVLKRAPNHPRALFGLGQLAFQAGEGEQSVRLLRHACAVTGADPEPVQALAFVLEQLGRPKEAGRRLAEWSTAHPDAPAGTLATLYLRAGVLALAAGDEGAAAEAFQRLFVVQPNSLEALDDPDTGEDVREALSTAWQTLSGRYRAMRETVLAEVRTDFPGAALERLDGALSQLSYEAAPEFADPLQQPFAVYVPDLPVRAWFEPAEFPWYPHVKAAYPAIREELHAALAYEQTEFLPYVQGSDSDREGDAATDLLAPLRGSRSWTAFHLYKNGTRFAHRCAICPVTEKAVLPPSPFIPNQKPEILFSRLQPGGHIVPHFGMTNAILTAHLALQIPSSCGLRAGSETRPWKEGDVFVFDDSFDHEAWNRDPENERMVLIFEVWNPTLNEAEQFGLQRMFERRRAWLDHCGERELREIRRRS